MNSASVPWRRGAWWLILCVALAGFAARLYKVGELPQGYWTVRQYYSMVITRAWYFADNPRIEPWRREVAATYPKWWAEAPILEFLAGKSYRVLGAERIWVPRLLVISFWMVGAFCLYRILARYLSAGACAVGLAYYLFNPYGFTASRSLQPEAGLIMGLLAGLLVLVRYFEKPTWPRLLAAGLTCGLGFALKTGTTELIVALAFLLLSASSHGWVKTLTRAHSWAFGAVALGIPVLMVTAATVSGVYNPGWHFMTFWNPEALRLAYFYTGWLGIVLLVAGLWAIVPAVSGFFLIPHDRLRRLVGAWCAGYVAHRLIFSYTTPNHDYQHLMLIPLFAIGLAACSEPVLAALRERVSRAGAVALAAGLLGVCLLALPRAPWRQDVDELRDYPALAAEIGEKVGHSTRTVILDYDFEKPLQYFAEIGGAPWPEYRVIQHKRRIGKADGASSDLLSAAERFERYYAAARPEYFIVCRVMEDIDRQPGLKEFLGRFPVVARTARYAIFDLRAAVTPGAATRGTGPDVE